MENVDNEISGLTGQTVTKEPGSIKGETFTISGLTECTVYLLDYTSEVEVKDVTNCQLFIGPVDGPAIFENVSKSRVAVAAQQFQAKNVQDTEFELFSATQPTLNNCAEVKIGCWRGAYSGLIDHFQAAHLDPNSNHWNKAKDISAEDIGNAFQLVSDVQPWEVPTAGGGPPENPVPFSEGLVPENGGYSMESRNSAAFVNGHVSAELEGNHNEHPKLTAINAKLKERQGTQESHEKEVKTQLVQKAAKYLEDFYKNRNIRISQRAKSNRESEVKITDAGPEGNTEWEKAVNLINFGFNRPNGTDLSRFKTVLFSAKSKNMPIGMK